MQNLLNFISFRTTLHTKNSDIIVNSNDKIITEYRGVISKLRTDETPVKKPLIIGEYSFSIWNISLAKILNIDVIKLIKEYKSEDSYNELQWIIAENKLDINESDKLMIIHGLIIRPSYRKLELSQEFIEFIYKNFYNNEITILSFVKPIQNNELSLKNDLKDKSIKNEYDESIPLIEYYEIDDLMKKNDTEANEYRLFSVATKCGFNRLGESYLFQFKPEIIVNRIKNKHFNNLI